jgi:hypothetical protein
MPSSLRSSRWRHVLFMLPLGVVIGLAVGAIFRDLLFGIGVGAALGALFGLLLAIRNPKST